MTDPIATEGALPGYEFIKTVLSMLVEDKDQLVVDSRLDELGVLITVKVSDRDMGKLIGKSGQTIKSVRTLLRVIGGASNQRVNLKVLEPEKVPA
ncbi:MAG: KH domain-containing protein [Candidatus Peribacteraceae bacterium]|nr:KH domain-containing protein [Candidatus Peribacteraceae bacterium]MBP9850512.1 KH domain-containing protein [Candidatus Peribacteraceae bacterium]